MKKCALFLTVILVLLSLPAMSFAAALNFSDDFESYATGHFTDYTNWPSTAEKISSGGDIQIVQDGAGQAIKMLIQYNGLENDSYMQSQAYDFSGRFTVRFRFKTGAYSDGSFSLNFRDSKQTGNFSFAFINIRGTKVTYLPAMYSPTSTAPWENVTPGSWNEIVISADIPKGTIAVYRDGVQKVRVADYRTQAGGGYADFVFSSSSVRPYMSVDRTVGNTAEIYLDDFKINTNVSLTEDLTILQKGLFLKVNDTLYDINSLKNGNLVYQYCVQNFTGEAVQADAVAAIYHGSKLKSVTLQTGLSFDAGASSDVSLDILAPQIEEGDVLKVFLLSGMNQIRPVSEKGEYGVADYYRPIAPEILADLQQTSPNQQHPRLMLTPTKLAQLRYDCKNTEPYKAWYTKVKSAADGLLSASVCSYSDADELRLLSAGTVQERTFTLAFAYLMEGSANYKTRLYTELVNASAQNANWPDWNVKHFLDTSALCAAFGVAYDWLYSAWSTEEKALIKSTLLQRGLQNAQYAYDGKLGSNGWWVTTDNNWNMVCNGGVAVGALAVADEADASQLCGDVLEKGLVSLEKCIPNFAPDGAWYEGPGYWQYAVQYMAMYFDSLQTAAGTDYAYLSKPGISKTGYYPIGVTGILNSFNLNDAGEAKIIAPEFFYLASRFQDASLAAYHYRQINEYSTSSIKDILWYDPALTGSMDDIPKDFDFGEAEVATFRDSYFSAGSVFAGIHGGKNGINHGQIDAGNFVYDAAGVRWAVDLGGDNYNLYNYFNNNNIAQSRWGYYRNRGEGHNTVILNPGALADQPLDVTARITEFSSDEASGRAVVDMTPIYAQYADSASRTAEFDKQTGALVLTDNIVFKSDGNQLYWFMHTKADITLVNGGKSAILAQSGKYVRVDIEDDVNTFTVADATPLSTSPNPNTWAENMDNSGDSSNPTTQNANTGVKKLVISNANAGGNVQIKVSMHPEALLRDDFESYTAGDFTDTSKWSIVEKPETGGDIQIVQEEGNKALKTTITRSSTQVGDAYIESPAFFNLNGKFVMNFRARLQSSIQGSFMLNLRDDNSDAGKGTCTLLTVSNGKLSYLPSMNTTAVTESWSNGAWAVIKVEADIPNGIVRIYRDGVKKAEVTDLFTRQSAKFATYNFAKCRVRLYTSVDSATGSKVETRTDDFWLVKYN